MWVADMDIATPQFIFDDIQKRLKHKILGYEEFPLKAKKAQIKWMKENHNYKIKADDILYSHSVVTSISLAIRAFAKKGEEVIVQTPVYSPFYRSITNNKRKILKNPLKLTKDGDYTFDFEDLKSKITKKTKLLILCSPHNPVGRVWSKEELTQLANICLENNIKIFSDEIHSDLVYKDFKHTPIASISKEIENITLTALGVGKTFNLAGVATSTVVIPNKKMKEKFKKVYYGFHLADGNIVGHISFTSAYKKGKAWRDGLMDHLQNNIDKLNIMLEKHQDKITMKKPEGTYLVWLNCKKMDLSDKELREFFIKEAKLGLSPGVSFGKEGTGYMRLNIAVPKAQMQIAINRIDKALKNFAKDSKKKRS
jgi:cystathionine beta-lyase